MFATFKYHKNLAPKIWGPDNSLNSLVSQSLQTIILDFTKYLSDVIGMPISKSDIMDVFVHGSITNYYWDDCSDIDLCIILNTTAFHDVTKLKNRILFDRAFISSWLRTYDISIFGYGVDISFVDKDSPRKVGPIYSLLKDRWLVPPKRISKQELRRIKKLAKLRYRIMMHHCRYMLRHKMPSEYVDAYTTTIQRKRIDSMYQNPDQPITSMTMAFKMLRNTGILRKLRNYSRHDRSRKYQLK